MIVVHDGTVGKQSSSLGWRSWYTAATQPLRDYFTDVNVCGTSGSGAALSSFGSSFSQVTDGVIDGAVYDLLEEEPMVYHDYDVYANVETGNSKDINRLSARSGSSHFDVNRGWGLGT